MEFDIGLFLYLLSVLTMGGIYALIALGLNVQWGYAGLFNAGIAGFVAVGAYTFAILTTASSPLHIGGFGLPFAVGIIIAMLMSGIVAAIIGLICIRLRSDYLAIATIGIAEIIKLVLLNEDALTNGPRGIAQIPRAWESMMDERFYNSPPMSWIMDANSWQSIFVSLPNWWWQPMFTITVLLFVYVTYRLLENARKSPWGRMMRAIRENELAAASAGKNVNKRRIEAFIIGSFLMGLAGALLAQHIRLIDPINTFDPAKMTFLVWIMLIAGGSGNNKGAILGAFIIYTLWSSSELLIQNAVSLFNASQSLVDQSFFITRASYLRMLLIGLILQFLIQRYPKGILPEPKATLGGRKTINKVDKQGED